MDWENGRNLKSITTSIGTIKFKYNANGLRTYKSTKYFFIKNQQGDVEQIVDRAGGIEVRYNTRNRPSVWGGNV